MMIDTVGRSGPCATDANRRWDNSLAKDEGKSVRWAKRWEFCLAALALVELWSCFSWSKDHHTLLAPVAVPISSDYLTSLEDSSKGIVELLPQEKGYTEPKEENNRGGVTSVAWLWGQYNGHNFSWKVIFDRVFMTALLFHSVLDSWMTARAFRTTEQMNERATKEENKLSEGCNDSNRTERLRQEHPTRYLPFWDGVLVFARLLILHILLLPLLSRGTDLVPVETRQNILSSMWGFFSRRNQKVSFVLQTNYASTARTYSVVEDFLVRCYMSIRASVSPALRAGIKARKGRITKKLAKLAIRHPWHFRLRLTQVFAFIRWAKFLAPLVGASNKLRGNLLDFIEKWRTRQRKKRASRAWSFVLDSTTSQQRGEAAATQILENFRFKKCQQMLQDLVEKDERETEAVTKIQTTMRARMASECDQTNRAKKRLFGLKRRRLSAEERREARELKRVLRARSRANRKLLLRPNSAFSVTWKIIAITCVALEVFQSVLAPRLSGKMEKLPLDHMLEALLTPKNSTKQASVDSNRLVGPHVFPFAKGWTTRAAICASCGASALENIWSLFVQCFLQKFVFVVEIVCFLDVFITFFTGEFDKTTGVLVPKPFFKRWILPGVALQLIVNPAMNKVCDLTKELVHFAADVGPTRVAHIVLALAPLAQLLIDSVTDLAFFLIQKANRHVVTSIFNR